LHQVERQAGPGQQQEEVHRPGARHRDPGVLAAHGQPPRGESPPARPRAGRPKRGPGWLYARQRLPAGAVATGAGARGGALVSAARGRGGRATWVAGGAPGAREDGTRWRLTWSRMRALTTSSPE